MSQYSEEEILKKCVDSYSLFFDSLSDLEMIGFFAVQKDEKGRKIRDDQHDLKQLLKLMHIKAKFDYPDLMRELEKKK